jgi:pSer/pThr/pTyr-binding forkhead associated (FHA) protein
MTHLLITRGAEAGTRIVLSGFPVSIGRDESNEVSLQDSEVSRHHARIKQNGRLFILEDLESKNGVFLNGDKILNSIINNEDRILIGSTELVFFANAQDIHLAGDLLALEFSYSEDPELSLPFHLDREPP